MRRTGGESTDERMSTTYTGIDYGLGRSNVDNETGIRFGVVSQGSLMPEAFDDVWTQARDLTYESAVESAKRDIAALKSKAEFVAWFNEYCAGEIEIVDVAELPELRLGERENDAETV